MTASVGQFERVSKTSGSGQQILSRIADHSHSTLNYEAPLAFEAMRVA
jgi:hypothetical protein